MENSRHSSTWALLLCLNTFLSLPSVSHAQDSTYGDASGDAASENAAGASGSGSSFVGSKGRDIIIILSVVVGVVVILGVSSAILFVVAKRRQWAVRETMRRSARRVTDAIKSPLSARFPKSPRDAPPPSARSRKGAVRIETTRSQHDSRSRSSASFNPKTKPARDSRRGREIDLERGIELKATKASTVQVSTKESSLSQDSDSNGTQKGWGTFFLFGRR